MEQGRNQEFSKGGGGVTQCQSEGTHQIFMSFSLPAVGCLLKNGLQKGEGVTGTPGPPSYDPVEMVNTYHGVAKCC